MLKSKGKSPYSYGKPISFGVAPSAVPSEVNPTYITFISDGFVSLVVSAEKVPVKIMRDTGASRVLYFEGFFLPFSSLTSLGPCWSEVLILIILRFLYTRRSFILV